ncbi:Rrp15p-domain-containing protein [Phycomyces nitens]|nr:Rrp15p-domain-containing protein [Phycomyces nitens]
MAKKIVKKQEIPAKKIVKEDPVVSEDEDSQSDAESVDQESDVEDERDSFNGSDLDSDADNEEENDEYEPMEVDPHTVKPKKKVVTDEAFAEAMKNILGSTLKAADKKQPILARSKGTERKIEDERLDHKARKVLSAEKRALKAQGRVIPDFTNMEYEKALRKVATRGVVKLFNAINTQQKVTDVAVSKATEVRKAKVAIEKAKTMSVMPKSSFLELLKVGNNAKK